MKKAIKIIMNIGAFVWVMRCLGIAFNGVMNGVPVETSLEHIAVFTVAMGIFEGICTVALYVAEEIRHIYRKVTGRDQ